MADFDVTRANETTYGSAYAYGGDFEVHPAGTAVEIGRLRAELADAIKAIDRLHDERRRWIEAFGLVSTVCPSMEIDTSQPMKMAKTMVQYVDDLRNKGQELDDKCEALRKMDDIVEQLRALEKREAGNCYSVNKAMLDAAAEIERLRTALEAQAARIAELEGLLRRIEPYMDGLICYASTMGEHAPNRIAHDLRAALPPEVKP